MSRTPASSSAASDPASGAAEALRGPTETVGRLGAARTMQDAHALADSTALALQQVRAAERRAARMNPDDARERRAAKEAMPMQTDPLTGLPLRPHWDRALRAALSPAEQPVCVALLSIDRCGSPADPHGTGAADALVRSSAAAWRARLRSADLLAHYRAGEFAVLLMRCHPSAAGAVVRRLLGTTSVGLVVSIGLAAWDGDETVGTLVCRADLALYRAKRDGRDVVLAD